MKKSFLLSFFRILLHEIIKIILLSLEAPKLFPMMENMPNQANCKCHQVRREHVNNKYLDFFHEFLLSYNIKLYRLEGMECHIWEAIWIFNCDGACWDFYDIRLHPDICFSSAPLGIIPAHLQEDSHRTTHAVWNSWPGILTPYFCWFTCYSWEDEWCHWKNPAENPV